MKTIFEQYRPKTYKEVVGQNKILKRIDLIKRRGLGGKAFMLTGPSGTGKTTIAYLMANDVTSDFEEIDATALTVASLREIETHWNSYGMGEKQGKAFIINEAHGLRKDVIRQLLVILERIPSHVTVIFTTTVDGMESFEDQEDAGPFLSRLITLKLSQRGLAEVFAEKALQIAIKEDLNDKELKDYINLAKRLRNNFRAMLTHIESGAMLS